CQLSAFLSSRAVTLTTWDICTDDQCPAGQCSPISARCQCPSMPPVSAHQCTSMPHISAHLSCLSVSTISASLCHLSMPVSATYEC
ncbi:unnamed protein product, partial [Staurois parvus]